MLRIVPAQGRLSRFLEGAAAVHPADVAGVPQGTVAAARITTQDAYGFVALSNDVNYAVPGDGSLTFMAAGEAGYNRLLGAPSE